MTNTTNTTEEANIRALGLAVRLVHLNAGWRYWVFDPQTGDAPEIGLSNDGYATLAEAEAAAKAVRAAETDECVCEECRHRWCVCAPSFADGVYRVIGGRS